MPRRDPHFNGPSFISAANGLNKATVLERSDLVSKLDSIGGAVTRIRDSLPKSLKRTLQAENTVLLGLLTGKVSPSNKEQLSAIADFRAQCPLVSDAEMAKLTCAPDAGSELFREWEEAYEAEEKSPEQMRQFLGGLAKHLGHTIKAKDIDGQLAEIRSALTTAENKGAPFVERGHGSESKVYTSELTGCVYKVAPIRESIFDIPSIEDESPLYPRLSAFPLVGPNGRVPLVDRLRQLALMPNTAPADLVGLTEKGYAIFCQKDLGEVEPSMGAIKESLTQSGYGILPSQGEDPKGDFDNDTSILPAVTVVARKPVLLLDVNPRNSRLYEGEVFVFDPVCRELEAVEVSANPQIRDAIASREQGRLVSPQVMTEVDSRVRNFLQQPIQREMDLR